MSINEFFELCKQMVVKYWNTYVSEYDPYNRIIDIHQVCLNNFEEDNEGNMKMSLVVNGEETRTFNIEYSNATHSVTSYIN